MRRTLAKLLIDFASDFQSLPVWVRRMMKRDASVRTHYLATRQLEQRLKQDRDAWLGTAQPAPGLTLNEAPNHLASGPQLGSKSTWHLPFASTARPMIPLAAGLVLLLLASWWLWGDRQPARRNWEAAVRQTEDSADLLAPGQQPLAGSTIDWRPLLAAASAGQQVTRRITESTGEWIANTTDVAGQAMRRPIDAGSTLPDEVWSEGKAGVRAALRPLTMMLNLGQADEDTE